MSPYHDTISLIERLHRQFLELLKVELERGGLHDINNVQSLILYNIGEDEMTVGELTARGYYLGSNVSYNVKKMVEHGYLEQNRSIHDKRSMRVKASAKGLKLNAAVTDLYDKHIESLDAAGLTDDVMAQMNDALQRVEKFWDRNMGLGIVKI